MHYNLLLNNNLRTRLKLNGSIKICKLNIRMMSIPLQTFRPFSFDVCQREFRLRKIEISHCVGLQLKIEIILSVGWLDASMRFANRNGLALEM